MASDGGQTNVERQLREYSEYHNQQPRWLLESAERDANGVLAKTDKELAEWQRTRGLKDPEEARNLARNVLNSVDDARHYIAAGDAQWAGYHCFQAAADLSLLGFVVHEEKFADAEKKRQLTRRNKLLDEYAPLIKTAREIRQKYKGGARRDMAKEIFERKQNCNLSEERIRKILAELDI